MITQDLSATVSFYNKPFLSYTPDECVVRSLSYQGPTTAISGVYLIWCSLINDFICSFSVDASSLGGTKLTHSVNVFPQTRIMINTNLICNEIQYKIYAIDPANNLVQCSTLAGEMALTLEFVEYGKNN
jgi:hypothetical protein